MKLKPPRTHNLATLEFTYRFLFLLRDLGIESAHLSAVLAWDKYVQVSSQLVLNEMQDSQ